MSRYDCMRCGRVYYFASEFSPSEAKCFMCKTKDPVASLSTVAEYVANTTADAVARAVAEERERGESAARIVLHRARAEFAEMALGLLDEIVKVMPEQAPGGEWTDATAVHLDPGIGDVVMCLRSRGFETTDSGDGVSKADDALPFAHVCCVVPGEYACDAADGIGRALNEAGFVGGAVELTYKPSDGIAVVIVTWPPGHPGEHRWPSECAK